MNYGTKTYHDPCDKGSQYESPLVTITGTEDFYVSVQNVENGSGVLFPVNTDNYTINSSVPVVINPYNPLSTTQTLIVVQNGDTIEIFALFWKGTAYKIVSSGVCWSFDGRFQPFKKSSNVINIHTVKDAESINMGAFEPKWFVFASLRKGEQAESREQKLLLDFLK